jgi:putative SOS response-associated peptidase YedK
MWQWCVSRSSVSDQQDKRSVAPIDPADWDNWLHGTEEQAFRLVKPQPVEAFDLTDAMTTDALLASRHVFDGAQGRLL